jgi:nucleoid-associated protein YgaU
VVALLADIPRIAPTEERYVPLRALPASAARPTGVSPRRPMRRPAVVPARPPAAVLRRRRMVAAGLLVATTMGALIGLQAALGRIGGGPLAATGAPGGLQPAATRVWVVRPGDTLWSIAEAVDPGGDVRPLVDRLAAQVRSTALFAGETIAIPGA